MNPDITMVVRNLHDGKSVAPRNSMTSSNADDLLAVCFEHVRCVFISSFCLNLTVCSLTFLKNEPLPPAFVFVLWLMAATFQAFDQTLDCTTCSLNKFQKNTWRIIPVSKWLVAPHVYAI